MQTAHTKALAERMIGIAEDANSYADMAAVCNALADYELNCITLHTADIAAHVTGALTALRSAAQAYAQAAELEDANA
jgi:hypothetical protein